MDKLTERISSLSYSYAVPPNKRSIISVSSPSSVKLTLDKSSSATNFRWDYSKPTAPNGFRESFTTVNRRKITKHKKRVKKQRRN